MRAVRTGRILAAYALAGSLLTLSGWAFNVQRFADWDNDGIAQMPNNALAVGAAAAGLLLMSFGHRRLGGALAAFAALIGLATLFEWATNVDLGIDTLLFHREWGQGGTVSPGRMGFPGAVALIVAGAAILLGSFRRTRHLAGAGGLLMLAIAMLSLIGYLFHADPLYTIPRFTTIALQTSTMVLALGAALVASVPDHAPMRVLLGDSAPALLVRRALPVVVILPTALGWLGLRAQERGLLDTAFGTAMLVLTLIGLLAALLWWSARALAVHETALRESRDRFSLVFAKAPFGAALARLPGGEIVDINDAFREMFGFSREQVIGKTSLDLGLHVDPAQRTRLLEQLQRDGFVRDQELVLLDRARQERRYLNNITIIEIGGMKHLLTTVQDITDRKRAEDALRASSAALVAADRMKDEFLATLSHELRTPLTAIVGWSQMLLDGNLDTRDQQVALQAIRSSARAQAELIEDVLDVSRIVTGKMRLHRYDAELTEAVEAAAATVRPAAEAKRIQLRLSLEPGLPRLFIDPERIRQVVWNLLSNAIKFSPAETTVEVTSHAEEGYAVLEVVDHGPGIAPDFLPHVFERFRQADSSASRPHSGLGIGLALTRDLVELHGGSITAESELGRGSRFTVRLPLPSSSRSEGNESGPAALSQNAPLLSGIRVLYVDDRDDARVLISTMLKQHGAEVVAAESVDDALAALSDAPPHVVVTDLAMPGRDGYDLLATIRGDERWEQLPVVALTAQARAGDETRAAVAGFRAFLRKPVEAQHLAAAVASCLSS